MNPEFRMPSNKVSLKSQNVRIHMNKIYAPALHELIHYKKIPYNLLKYLTDKKYVNDYNSGEWMEIDSQVSKVYMHTLSEYAAKCYSGDIVVGTDSRKSQREIYTKSTTPRDLTPCLSLALNNCMPQPRMDVEFEQLLDFKEKREQEFLEFRKKLRDFEIILPRCESNEEITFRTEEFRESWQREIKQAQKMFRGDRIPFSLGSLHTLISVPSIGWAFNKMLQNFIPTQVQPLASSIMLGSIAVVEVGCQFANYRNKVNEHRSSSGFAYLIEASRDGIINPL